MDLTGDGRCNSPGHSAKYRTNVLNEKQTGCILPCEHVTVKQVVSNTPTSAMTQARTAMLQLAYSCAVTRCQTAHPWSKEGLCNSLEALGNGARQHGFLSARRLQPNGPCNFLNICRKHLLQKLMHTQASASIEKELRDCKVLENRAFIS